MATRGATSGRVFVHLWDWPVRVMHWVAAACIVVLVVTGFTLGKPYFFVRGDEPRYVMGWMRLLHLGAAGILVATGIVRAYMLVGGSRFVRLPALVPHTRRDWANLARQAWYYATFRAEGAPSYLGHNPAQQLSYLGLYAVAAVMVATGFALYGMGNPGGFFDTTFSWVHVLLGNAAVTRFVHHALTWVFLVFVPIHVYLSLRADLLETPGMVSSMISGGRFVADRDHEDLPHAELREVAVAEPGRAVRVAGVAAVTAGLGGGVAFAAVQALVTTARGGRFWPPQEAVGAILLGRDFVITAETVPTWVLALVGLFAHGILSVIFGILIGLLVHRLALAAALGVGLAVGLALFAANAAALAATVVGVAAPWSLLPAHLVFGLVAAGLYVVLRERLGA